MGRNSGDRRGRPPVPSSQIRYDRIKMFMAREGLQHDSALAQKMGMAQQNLSRTLKNKKISESHIDRIIEAYPDYRAQWFLGYDEYPTWQEYEEAKRQETALRVHAIIDKSQSVYIFMSAILQDRGYTLFKISNSTGVDIDCRMYELIDRDGNVIYYRDDKIADRILRHAELELSCFLSDALTDSENNESPSP